MPPLFGAKLFAYSSQDFYNRKSDYWSGANTANYTHIGHTYFTGTYWDGLVQNKTWTYIDYELSNNYTATFHALLTSPQVKPWYVNNMKLTYKLIQTFEKQVKTSVYSYLQLADGYQIDSDLYAWYNDSVTTQGMQISVDVTSSDQEGYEYAIGLYKITMMLKHRKVYRYEVGSWWSKGIHEEVTNTSETVVLTYAAIPVRVDSNYRTGDYFYANSGISRKIIG